MAHTHGVKVIPEWLIRLPKRILSRAVRRHQMDEVQRAVQQPDMGHIRRVVQRNRDLVENILIPLLDSISDCVLQVPGWNLLLDVGTGLFSRDGRDAHARGDVRSRSIAPTEEGTDAAVHES